MKTTNKFWLLPLLPLVLLSLSATAADINQVDTNTQQQIRQLERERLLRQQQEIKPDVRDAGEKLKETVPVASDVIPDNETPCFTINRIELMGNSSDKFKFALNKVLDDCT